MGHFRKGLAAFLCAVLFLSGLTACAKKPEDTAADYYGTVKVYSTYEPDKDAPLISAYYFSDVWFTGDPAEQNDALARVSMQLTASAFNETGDRSPGASFLKELGFTEAGVRMADSAVDSDCGYTWGKKTLVYDGETYTLVAVAIQSVYVDKEQKLKGWVQNFTVNGDSAEGEHFAFKTAADSVIEEIEDLGQGENVRYWITGQSRGGAIAGIVSARLLERDPDLAGRIFTYTFEAPAMTDPVPGKDMEAEYPFIHNYLCTDDVVTMIPPWDMTRYGVTHTLNTADVNEGVLQEFEKLKSRGYEIVNETGEVPDAGENAEKIIGILTDAIPERADYSLQKEDKITDASGEEHTVKYSYQGFFGKLLRLIFGDDFSSVDGEALAEHVGEVLPMAEYLVNAVKNDDKNDYYNAAAELVSFLKNNGIELSEFGVDDFYVLFRLFGPVITETGYVPGEEDTEGTRVLSYLAPAVELFALKDRFTFSHQFDTCIARLCALSPLPEQGSIDMEITAPAAGDGTDKAPLETGEFTASLNAPWLEISSEWLEDGEKLSDNRVHYLRSTLKVKGHSIPDAFKWTINGQEPAEDLDIYYDNGIYVITGIWEYKLGTPEKVKISFDAGGHTEDPAAVEVDKGALLKYAITPEQYDELIEDGSGIWRFEGWYAPDGTPREDTYADDEVLLHAVWTEIIDNVVIDVPVPRVGDTLQEPSVPEGSPYSIEEFYYSDQDYNDITEAPAEGFVQIYIRISPDNGIRFIDDGSEFPEYAGTLTINGEEQVFNTYGDRDTVVGIEDGDGDYCMWVQYWVMPEK